MPKLKVLTVLIILITLIFGAFLYFKKNKTLEIKKVFSEKINLLSNSDFINIENKLTKTASRKLLNCETTEYWGEIGEVANIGDVTNESFEFIQDNKVLTFLTSMCSMQIDQSSSSAKFEPKTGETVAIELYKCKDPEWYNSSCNVMRKFKVEKVEERRLWVSEKNVNLIIDLEPNFLLKAYSINKGVAENEAVISELSMYSMQLEKWGALFFRSEDLEPTKSATNLEHLRIRNNFPRVYLKTIL